MKKNNKAFWTLIIALTNVAILSIGQALNNQIILAGAIFIFFIFLLYNYKEYFLPLMLFYLPWSSLLRFDPSQSSFHSIIVPVVFVILFVNYIKKYNDFRKNYYAYAIVLTAYTLIVKFLNGLSFNSPFIFFIIMLFFIPIYLNEYFKAIRFDVCIVFISIGNISAFIASYLLMTNQNVLKYIDINKEMQVGLRLSGFYGDPNYFSAQMLVAIIGLLIILTKVRNKKLILPIIIMVAALCYFAMQSVSKMFIISLVTVLFLWIVNMLVSRMGLGYKLGILTIIAAIIIIVMLENVFMKEIDYYLLRFGKVRDSISLTTGRIVLWKIYIDYLLANPEKLFFGIGVSDDQIRIIFRTNNAHMTVIQTIYQLGIVGTAMFVLWWKSIYNALFTKLNISISDLVNLLIMALAIFLPWLALDMFYFREFFYFVILLFLLLKYLTSDQSINVKEENI